MTLRVRKKGQRDVQPSPHSGAAIHFQNFSLTDDARAFFDKAHLSPQQLLPGVVTALLRPLHSSQSPSQETQPVTLPVWLFIYYSAV